MQKLLAWFVGIALVVDGCATVPPPATVARLPTAPASPASTPAPTPTDTALAVTATPPPDDPLTFDVTGQSDLPSGPARADVSLRDAVESAAASIRPALVECLRPLGLVGHQGVHVTVNPQGELQPMPPQPFAVTPTAAACIEGVLRATTVEPPPPRTVPWDLTVDIQP